MITKVRKNMTYHFNHVMVRGHNKQAIYIEKNDYEIFLKILEDVCEKYQCKIHLYCLMTNHIHLLVESRHISLSRIMQTLLSRYAYWFNNAKKREGYLFQGRYKAKSVSSKAYFYELIYYIHNNPVKANMVETMSDYVWSSHISYLAGKSSDFLSIEYLLKLIQKDFTSYENFIANFSDKETKSDDCVFDDNGLLNIETDVNDNSKNNLQMLVFLSFREICKVICELFDIEYEKLSSVSQAKNVCLMRSLCGYYAHFYGKISLAYIGIQFERNPRSFSQTMYSHINNSKNKEILKRVENEFEKLLAMKKFYRES